MLKIPYTPEIEKVAQRLIWFKSPIEALNDPYTFMAHVMTYGNLEDVLIVKRTLGLEGFKEALHHTPPGIMDNKSWNYWNLITGNATPPSLPTRTFNKKINKL